MSIPRLPHPASEELYASAATTATHSLDAQFNNEGVGLLIFVDVTALAATPSVTPKMQASLDNGTTWVDYVTAAAAITDVTGAGDYTYLLYPGIDASADGNMTESFNLPLPRCWRLTFTHADTDSITYSVRAMYL